MVAAVLLLSGIFFFPLWQITLEAAQFPGGLRLNIWINKFSGDEGGGDIIKNINILNHYIGMKYIEPDSIPELKYFPYVIFAMMGLGIIAALINKAWAYIGWVGIMVLLSIAGMYDFYLWMYDYGHNLDPKAPIKIEGMSYMPPLFGEKDLLNFYVKSYPHIGTLFLMLSMLTAVIASWVSLKSRSHAKD